MGLTCEIIAYRLSHSTALAANETKTIWRHASFSNRELRWFWTVLNVKTIQKGLNAENQPKISRESRGLLGSRGDVETVSLNHAKNQRKVVYERHRA